MYHAINDGQLTYEYCQQRGRTPQQPNPRKSGYKKMSNYSDIFSNNIKQSVKLPDIDLQLILESLKTENSDLQSQNQLLLSQIKDLNDTLTQYKLENESLKNDNNKITKDNQNLLNLNNSLDNNQKSLSETNLELQKKISNLNNENSQLNNIIDEQKKQYMLSDNEKLSYIHEIETLKDTLNNCKINNDDLMQSNIFSKTKMDDLKAQLIQEQAENECIKNKLREMTGLLNTIQSNFTQLKDENEALKAKICYDSKNAVNIIDDFKGQVDNLREQLDKMNQDKSDQENFYLNKQKNNENKIRDLTNLLDNLNDDYQKLKNKNRTNQEMNNKLLKEKQNFTDQINNLTNNLNNALLDNQRKKRRLPKNANNNLLNQLNNTNDDRQILEKLLIMLFHFINDLNALFGHDDISIDACKENPNILNNNLSVLRDDIGKLKQQTNEPIDSKDKWEQLQNKLFNRQVTNELTLKQENDNINIDNNFRPSKCMACNIGRNVTLKGCSPFFSRSKNEV